jgi:hypothetical protein
MVFPHEEVILNRKGVYHQAESTRTRGGDSFL